MRLAGRGIEPTSKEVGFFVCVWLWSVLESWQPKTGTPGGEDANVSSPFLIRGKPVMSNHEHDEPMLRFFAYEHLKPELQAMSAPFGDVAGWIVESLPRNPERTVCLRKLLEAKDCAVRAAIYP
jgi:hypothetical protein